MTAPETRRPHLIDGQVVTLLVGGALLLGLGFLFYRMDANFVARAKRTEATVTDKGSRSGDAGSSDRLWVAYEWQVEAGGGPPITWSGTDSWSGGEARWAALEPGSRVEILWTHEADGRSVESRLATEGFVGVPWPMVGAGALMLLGGLARLAFLVGKHRQAVF